MIHATQRILLALVLPTTSALAQAFSGTIATAGTLQATFGAQTQSSVVPAGPMGVTNQLRVLAGSQPTGFAQTDINWSFTQDPTYCQFLLGQAVTITGSTPASASFGPGDFLIRLQAPAPTTVLLIANHNLAIAQGMALPTLEIDLGDDGSVEFTSGQAWPTQVPLAIDPVGVPIRVRTQLALNTPGPLYSNVQLAAIPANTIAQTIVNACPLPDLVVIPHFDGAVSLQSQTTWSDPWAVIVGLSAQPTLLPHSTFPCLLLPAPDFVLWQPFTTLHTISLPAAVRPLTFWTQALIVLPTGLQTSEGYRVDAL
jgi:hypothetical protein